MGNGTTDNVRAILLREGKRKGTVGIHFRFVGSLSSPGMKLDGACGFERVRCRRRPPARARPRPPARSLLSADPSSFDAFSPRFGGRNCKDEWRERNRRPFDCEAACQYCQCQGVPLDGLELLPKLALPPLPLSPLCPQ